MMADPPPAHTVLVVDCEPDVLRSIEAILRLQVPPVRTLLAQDLGSALGILSRERVSLAVVDLCLPSLDGIGLAERARGIAPNLRFLFMTTFPDPSGIPIPSKLEPAPILVKPFAPDQFQGLVQSLLARAEAAHA